MSGKQELDKIFNDQDQKLGLLLETVGHTKEIATTINIELTQSEKLINDLHTETDKADSKLKRSVKKVNELLHKSEERCGLGLRNMILLLILIILLIATIITFL